MLGALARRVRGCGLGGAGYTQGMNYAAAALLLFFDEEEAFWVLVALVEGALDADFFAAPPAALNGLLAEAEVAHARALALSRVPALG